MKKKTDKPVPKINDLEEFQATYGEPFMNITRMPAFRAGLQLLNVRALNQLAALSTEDIQKNGSLILAEFVGLLKHENAIFGLHEEKTFKLPMEEETVYVSPEEEAAHEKLREKFAIEQRKSRYG